MTIITTYDQYIQTATDIMKSEKGKVRLSSFNLSTRDSATKNLLDLSLIVPSAILIGTAYNSCMPNCSACEASNARRSESFRTLIQAYNIKVTNKLHLKYFSRGDKAIVGGMNLTGSGFYDMAVVITDKVTIEEMNRHFDNAYRRVSLPFLYKFVEPTFPIGKYKGKTVLEVRSVDPSYISWAKKNLSEELKQSLRL